MIKKMLIVSMLLTSSVNADIFQALKDVASKVIEAQEGLNNPVDEHSNEDNIVASADQSSIPQFSSLAEESAYKKRQEEERQINKNENETKFKENAISRMKNLRAMRSNFYKKYFVKNTDTKEMIEVKFKNKAQLVQEMQNDRAILESEAKKIQQILGGSQYSLSQYYKSSEFDGPFPDRIEHSDEIDYVYSYDNPDTSGLARYIIPSLAN